MSEIQPLFPVFGLMRSLEGEEITNHNPYKIGKLPYKEMSVFKHSFSSAIKMLVAEKGI